MNNNVQQEFKNPLINNFAAYGISDARIKKLVPNDNEVFDGELLFAS